jgi:hypothetical protein
MDHLVVYDGDHILLAAYDAAFDPITISRELPDEVKQQVADLVSADARRN